MCNFYKLSEYFKSFARGLPTSGFMKFLAKAKVWRLTADLIIGMAPSDLRSFSDIFKLVRLSFYDKAIPIHSPPSGPRSLSLIAKDCKCLFLIRSAEIQTAPWIPNEFFLRLPSRIPRSKWVIVYDLIKSSKMNSIPSPEIIFEARFKL